MEVTREMAKTIAAWWGDRVRTDTHHDNGDRSRTGFLTQMLADGLNEPVSDWAREKFVEVLTEKILKEFAEHGRVPSYFLSCDYGPSKFLLDAAKEAGISAHNFPWKTHMQVWEEDDGSTSVYASCGYGAPWDKIFPIEEGNSMIRSCDDRMA